MENPFAEGENRVIRPPSTAVVIFGATGDLTHRKLIPALYNLAHDNYLPAEFIVVGAARSKLSDQEFRAGVYESVKKHSRRQVKDDLWKSFSEKIYYQSVDGNKAEDFVELRKRLEELCRKQSEDFNYLYYLAVAPAHFGPIATNLRAAGLVEDVREGLRSTSVVIEKPFGHDQASAVELNKVLRNAFSEKQIYRIDHYLGKETVQNILVFRFANGIFEPLWNHKHVDHIQISVCEHLGVEGRAPYFDKTGIMRDIVQNHLFQVLSLLCIEPPISLSDPDSIRDEKVKVMRSIKRFTREDVLSKTMRARYSKGFINGQAVPGYLEEEGVPKDSKTDTFVAMKLEIDNWRWFGVPIYVRAGKRMPKRITEITVYFKQPPSSLFKGRQVMELEQNVLAIQVQPDEGISLKIMSKTPGPRMRVRPVEMDFTYGGSFGIPSPDAYERLLLDSMKGDATLFTRDDEIEESWDLLAPIIETWESKEPPPVYEYPAGTWGCSEASQLLAPSKHSWRSL